VTHQTEQVIGWVSAGTVTSQRIFISRSQVPSIYDLECGRLDTLLPADQDLRKNFYKYFVPIYPQFFQGRLVGYWSNYPTCLDCRVFNSGTNKKPSYWPID
jgi:hypothetical protein